jgi:hypothetical protein
MTDSQSKLAIFLQFSRGLPGTFLPLTSRAAMSKELGDKSQVCLLITLLFTSVQAYCPLAQTVICNRRHRCRETYQKFAILDPGITRIGIVDLLTEIPRGQGTSSEEARSRTHAVGLYGRLNGTQTHSNCFQLSYTAGDTALY